VQVALPAQARLRQVVLPELLELPAVVAPVQVHPFPFQAVLVAAVPVVHPEAQVARPVVPAVSPVVAAVCLAVAAVLQVVAAVLQVAAVQVVLHNPLSGLANCWCYDNRRTSPPAYNGHPVNCGRYRKYQMHRRAKKCH
jgi:hypothetical protein